MEIIVQNSDILIMLAIGFGLFVIGQMFARHLFQHFEIYRINFTLFIFVIAKFERNTDALCRHQKLFTNQTKKE